MSQRGSQISSHSKTPPETEDTSQVKYNPFINSQNRSSSHSSLHKNVYTSAMSIHKNNQSRRLSSADVGKLTGSKFKDGQIVKGQSRINYVPYEKKVVDYQTRTYTQFVPKTKKIVEYQQKKIIQNVPRQVIRQEYYPVQKITKYCKQIIDIRPVQKKVKRMSYVPVEKQIVHYPGSEDYRSIQDQSLIVKQDAQYRPIQSNLMYQYASNPSNMINLKRYVDSGSTQNLSKIQANINSNLSSSKVQFFNSNSSPTQAYMNSNKQAQSRLQNSIKEKRLSKIVPNNKILSGYGSTGNLSAKNYM